MVSFFYFYSARYTEQSHQEHPWEAIGLSAPWVHEHDCWLPGEVPQHGTHGKPTGLELLSGLSLQQSWRLRNQWLQLWLRPPLWHVGKAHSSCSATVLYIGFLGMESVDPCLPTDIFTLPTKIYIHTLNITLVTWPCKMSLQTGLYPYKYFVNQLFVLFITNSIYLSWFISNNLHFHRLECHGHCHYYT